MSDEIDKLKKIVLDTQHELATESGNCWLWHKWSRWSGSASNQHRYCLRCSKQQELKTECTHTWEFFGEISNHTMDNRIVAVEKNYVCKKCSLRKRVLSRTLGTVDTDFY